MRDAAQRHTLLQVLLLNVVLAAGLLVAGLWADSSALIANSLDNASDAAVYGISYYAIAGSQRRKAAAATVSGVLLIILSLGVVADVLRRFATGGEPLGPVMIVMAFVATAINALCLKLLARDRRADVNLRTAWTFSINDFLSNLGIVVAGVLVLLLGRTWPDLVIGLAIAVVAAYGGIEILRDARARGGPREGYERRCPVETPRGVCVPEAKEGCKSAARPPCGGGGVRARKLALLSRPLPGSVGAGRRPDAFARHQQTRADGSFQRLGHGPGGDHRQGPHVAENPDLIGEQFLGRHTLATTSGTTGTPGIFVLDDRSMAVASAMALRMLRAWLGLGDLVRIVASGGRMAMTIAPGSHSATAVAAARFRKSASGQKRILTLSVHAPLSEMVAWLNEFRPAIVAPYASIGKLLAGEQEAGRLNIRPVLMALAAEGLPVGEYDRIAKVFGTKLGNSYAATECPFLSYGCGERWLHVNSDWAVLEPVDADCRPTPPGEQSHTVLLSNLANRVQPILRYDLGDSVVMRPDPCPCGNPLPAIRVRGRSADALSFPTPHGERVSIPPLALEVDHAPGVELCQIVQTTPTSLRVRLRPAAGADPDRVWQAVRTEIARLLAEHRLEHVTVERAEEPPEQSRGGKYRTVIPLS